MPDRDVVLAKVSAIQKCLRRIKDITGLNPDRLDDIDVQDIFVLNLQRSIQSAIDLATHIIASEGLGIAKPSEAISYYSKMRKSSPRLYPKRCNPW